MKTFDWFFRQKVTEAELDAAFAAVESAIDAVLLDNGIVGVTTGGAVAQHAGTPNLTVDVSGPSTIYDQLGRRISWTGTQNVNCSVDENSNPTAVTTPGNERWLSIFAEFVRAPSDPRIDGEGNTVYFEQGESFELHVVMGTETVIPTATKPALRASEILLADVYLINGQTQILNAGVNTTRREWAIKTTTGTVVACGTLEKAIQVLADAIASGGSDLAAHIAAATNQHLATAVNFAGGPTWHDGTTNPAATVEAQLDKVVTELADASVSGNGGGDKVGIKGQTVGLVTVANGSIFDQIAQLMAEIDDLKIARDVGPKIRASNWRRSAQVSSAASCNVQAIAANLSANGLVWGAVAEGGVPGTEVRYSNDGPLSGWSAGGALPGTVDRIRAIAYSPKLNVWVVAGRISAAAGAYIASGTFLAALTERTATGMLSAGDEIVSLIWDPVGARFIAGGANGKIIRSSDGSSWAAATTPGGSVDVVDLAVNPSTGTLVAVIATGGSGQAWRSLNNGSSWSLTATLTGSDAGCCCFDAVGNYFWAGCDSCKIWRAASTGTGWTDLSPTGVSPGTQAISGIAAADDGLVLASTIDEAIFTLDSGTKWEIVEISMPDGSPGGGAWGVTLRFIGGRFVAPNGLYLNTSLVGSGEFDVT